MGQHALAAKTAVPASEPVKQRASAHEIDATEEFVHSRVGYSLAAVPTFAAGDPDETANSRQRNAAYKAGPRLNLQAKLMVGAVNDPLEMEADRVADQVMRMPEPRSASQPDHAKSVGTASHGNHSAHGGGTLQRKCDCGGSCDDCQKKHEDDQSVKVQMKAAGTASAQGMEAPPIVHEVLRSPGRPLDSATRSFMEPRFGHDFSNVRIHTDAKAAESAKAVGARAYTVGSNVVFGAGEYGPRSAAGKSLLGHELAHVVQQGLMPTSRVQCDPDPDVPNPDTNEADARAAGATLPVIDRTTLKSKDNEAAAQAIVLTAFGGEDGVNAAFERLSPIVKTMVDGYVAADEAKAKLPADAHVSRVTANRAQFLGRMRLYFNSWQEVIDHFSAIEPVDKKFKTVQMSLHRDARVRFERAAAALLSKGHSIPTIGGGFSIRGFHRGEIMHKGMMIHAMGYAFDVDARENPKLANSSQEHGLERHDANQVAVTVGAPRGQMNLGNPQQTSDLIVAMGKGTVDDHDPSVIKFFKLFEEQFSQMQAGSLRFTQKISSKNRAELLKLRDDYLQVLKKIEDEKKRKPKADPKVIEQLKAERLRLLSRIPALVTEWVAAIDAEIADVFKKHPGMDKLRPPSDISHDLKNKAAEAEADKKNLSRAKATKATADAKLRAAEQQVALAKQALAGQTKAEARDRIAPSRDPDWGPVRQSTQKLKKRREQLESTLFDNAEKAARAEVADENAEDDLNNIQDALNKAKTSIDSLNAELKKSDTKEFHGAWSWIGGLRELRGALSAPDLSTAAGVHAFERLTTGDLKELGRDAPVDNPPLLRLLQTGFFNPKGAFDLAFFEEMTRNGFFPGAAWPLGGADPMHFELVEGRRFLQTPGTDLSNF